MMLCYTLLFCLATQTAVASEQGRTERVLTLQEAPHTSLDNAFENADELMRQVAPFGLNQLGATRGSSARQWIGVTVLTGLLVLALTPILFREGVKPFATVVTYLACLSLVKMFVKETISLGLECPDFITLIHMISTAAAACALERPRLDEALPVLPISIVTGTSLVLNNTALVYGGVAFTSMIACTTPVFTFILEVARAKRSLEFVSVGPVLLVVSGAMFCVHGESSASMLAFSFAAASTCFRAMKSVWQQDLLTVQVSPLRLAFWSGLWSFLVMIPIMLWSEGTQGLLLLPELTSRCKLSLLLSALAACTLNIVQCYAVKQLGALMQSITGNLNLILVIALSQAWLGEAVTLWQYLGVILMVAGTVLRRSEKKKDDAKIPSEHIRFAEEAPEGCKYNSASGCNASSPPIQTIKMI